MCVRARAREKMCFNQPMSFSFAFVGLAAAVWIHRKTNNAQLAQGVFFYFLMEFLQGLQVLWVGGGGA